MFQKGNPGAQWECLELEGRDLGWRGGVRTDEHISCCS